MGTLFDQRPRLDTLATHVRVVMDVAAQLWPDVKVFTPAHYETAARVAEAALKIQGADVLDEQLGGFGVLLTDLISALKLRA